MHQMHQPQLSWWWHCPGRHGLLQKFRNHKKANFEQLLKNLNRFALALSRGRFEPSKIPLTTPLVAKCSLLPSGNRRSNIKLHQAEDPAEVAESDGAIIILVASTRKQSDHPSNRLHIYTFLCLTSKLLNYLKKWVVQEMVHIHYSASPRAPAEFARERYFSIRTHLGHLSAASRQAEWKTALHSPHSEMP